MTDICILALSIGSVKLDQQPFQKRERKGTCVVKTSINVPVGCLIMAVATPFPAYQSPLHTAVGRPFRMNGYILVLIIGHLENITNPLPRNPAKKKCE
jgi:hypothetical protein